MIGFLYNACGFVLITYDSARDNVPLEGILVLGKGADRVLGFLMLKLPHQRSSRTVS